jgi:O-antigen ligase/8-oxo-dGTP pyrophosphatase MutT (NUDIX family)
MKAAKLLEQIDRWGTVFLIYLIPWGARLIFVQGILAGVPSEPQTRSLFAVEVLIAFMLVVRLAAITGEKDKIARSRWYTLSASAGIWFALAALSALTLLSVIIAGDQAAVVISFLHLAEGLGIFFLVVTAPSEREARLAFVASAAVQSAIALAQAFFQRVYPDTWLGIAAHYPEFSGTSVVEAAGERFLRAYGSLPHPNILGGMIVVAILCSRPLWRRFSVYSASVYFLLSLGLFLSFSRLAWLALAVGLVTQALYARRDKIFVKNAAVVVATMVVMAVLFAPLVLARATSTGRLETKSIATRLATFKDAWQLIRNQPFTGVGAGNFTAAVLEQVDPARNGYALEPVHSVFADVFSEIGFFGFLLFVWIIYLLAISAWRSGKLGLAVALIILALGDHWGWTTFAGVIIFWAGWGFTRRGCCDEGVIHKAGAIILSHDDPNRIVLLFRAGPSYCDWTIPKGHMEPNESREDTALREVKEETGLDIKLIAPLPDRRYTTGSDHPAIVHFFLARSLDDSKLRLEPGFPDNQLKWVALDEVTSVLSFDNMKKYFQSILPIVKTEAVRQVSEAKFLRPRG